MVHMVFQCNKQDYPLSLSLGFKQGLMLISGAWLLSFLCLALIRGQCIRLTQVDLVCLK
jgi:hypothetical protein